MSIPFRYLPALLLFAALSAPALAADEAYTIKLTRPDKAGDINDIQATIDSTRTSTAVLPQRDPQIQTQVIKGTVEGRVEYLKVDKMGDAISLVLTIKKLVDGDGVELLKPGQEVKIEREAKSSTLTLVDGTALSPEAEKFLTELYGPHTSDGPSDDQAFGSPDKHKVGDSWSINPELTAKGISASGGLDIDPSHLTGTTTVKAVETMNGLPMLRIGAAVLIKDATFTSPNPDVKVDSLNMQVDESGLFPVDTALPSPETIEKMTMEMHLTTTNGAAVTMKATSSKSVKLTPVKK